MARPEQIRVDHTVEFLRDALGRCARVLEVGCGRGTVARRLGVAGISVTAIDVELRDRTPASNVTFIEGDFLDLAAPPFDAIMFTASLHHIAPIARAIDHAAALLARGGLLLVDDFDIEAVDPDTLRWYYDVQELLVAAGCYEPSRVDRGGDDLIARWRRAHDHEPPLHTGAAMRLAISDRFAIRELRRVAYLHRYIGSHVPDDERGGAIAHHVLDTEQRKIAAGTIAPIGLRIVAERAS